MKVSDNSVLSIDAPVADDVQNPKKTQARVSVRKEGRIVLNTVLIMLVHFIKLKPYFSCSLMAVALFVISSD